MNPLPLTLEKSVSVLDGLEMVEVVPMERIQALLKSDLLLVVWDKEKETGYPNEKEQIGSYYKKYNKKVGGVVAKYRMARHKWGRAFPDKSLGLSALRRATRNSMIDGIYYDFDLKNAQPEIIRNLCESNSIPCPIIKRYCSDRASLLKEGQDTYQVSRDIAKDLFIRLCFSGSFVGWTIDNKIQNRNPLEFITLFERELKDIAEKAKKANPVLYETARKKKEENGENKENRIMGSFFALFNQEYEKRIVEKVLCYLINKTDLMKLEGTKLITGAYEYDGLKLLKANVDTFEGGVDGVVQLLMEKTQELTGFKLEWANKEFEDKFDLTEWLEEIAEENKLDEKLVAVYNDAVRTKNYADVGICEIVMKILPNNFVYSVSKDDGSKGDWYGWNGNRWEKGDAPFRRAIMYEVEKYFKDKLKDWEFANEDRATNPNAEMWFQSNFMINGLIDKLNTANGINNIVSVGKTLMANHQLEFDTREDLFGCENGVIDIANECFRPYKFDDYMTSSCGYEFTPNLIEGFKVLDKDGNIIKQIAGTDAEQERKQYDTLADIYKKIHPDSELRNYFFNVISTGMSGRAIEKFFVFNGAGRNGKGFTNEFLEVVFGDYFVSVSPVIFTENQKNKNSSGPNPEIAKLDKKRYVVAKEPAKDQPLHNSVIKDLTGGGMTSARMCHSNKTSVKLAMTCIMECNVKPPFSEAPKDADIDRINDIMFASRFSGEADEWSDAENIYPLDVKLKSSVWKDEHKNAMLNILLMNLLIVKSKDYNVDAFKPESVKKRSLEYLQNSYDLHNIFTQLFEKRIAGIKYLNHKNEPSDEDWSLAKVATTIKNSGAFYELSASKKKEYSAKGVIEDFFRTNKIYKSSVYTDTHTKQVKVRGWGMREPAEEEE